MSEKTKMRDELRTRFGLGAEKRFRREKLTITPPDGEPFEVEVRQPSVAERSRILTAGGADKADKDIARLQVEAVLSCTVVPGSDDKVFEEADREVLLSSPAGGWLDELAEKALSLLNVDRKALEKN